MFVILLLSISWGCAVPPLGNRWATILCSRSAKKIARLSGVVRAKVLWEEALEVLCCKERSDGRFDVILDIFDTTPDDLEMVKCGRFVARS